MFKYLHLIIIFSLLTSLAEAQSTTPESPNSRMNSPAGIYPSGAYFSPVELQVSECISEEQRQLIYERIEKNKQKIAEENPGAFKQKDGKVLFVLPIQAKPGFDDHGYYTLHFQVDQNLTPGNNLLDYNCGERTYDWSTGNHQGSDYILWPYPWKRMQEEVMEIVAAAPGVIVDKRDGFFDMNCSNTGNPNWNGIVLEHADGSQTWYLHFKNGAITSKGIGDAVEAGEYLGAAGSSGSSDWPHLHFEVRDSDGSLIDPYAGACNSMNDESWWIDQPDYFIPTINRLSTHYTTEFDDDCPNIENTYEQVNFNPGDQLVIRVFYRDIQQNAATDLLIKNPSGNVYTEWTWNQSWGQDYATAMAYWYFNVTAAWPEGVYTLQVTFGGNTYETLFGVGTTIGIEDHQTTGFEMHPNPVTDQLNIEAATRIDRITILDMPGHPVIEKTFESHRATIATKSLSQGVYFIRIQSGESVYSGKFVKQ